MIASLSIENYALIDKLEVSFSPGLTIITGETGAGKSILLDALGLVLGQRADLSALSNKDQKCIVEAQFNLDGYNLKSVFEQLDWDYDPQTIIRREILPGGKSRAFVNDTPVTLADLQELAHRLVDVHSQHQTAEIAQTSFQLEMLDAVAGHADTLTQYKTALSQHKKVTENLDAALRQKSDALKESDYHSFLLEELTAAHLVDGEQESLEADFERGNNAEAIRQHLDKALALMHDEQYGILTLLKEFRATLQKLAGLSSGYDPLAERAQSSFIELDDLATELATSADDLEVDPELLEQIGQKLQLIYTLQKKHQVQSVAGLIAAQHELEAKVVSLAGLDDEITRLQSAKADGEERLIELSAQLSAGRKKAVPTLIESLTSLLMKLGMPHVQVKIDLSPAAEFTATGTDIITFLFSANKGADFGPLKKVASGGERSRIMLAVKYILAQHSTLPTIIFDEIDTGVSGEMADAMGNIMKSMSANMQVFSITHLPQIAAKGDVHFKVSKRVDGPRTTSTLSLLDREARIAELAKMLSGTAVSDSAINHARALLN